MNEDKRTLLTEQEQEYALKVYERFGWSFQEITECILHIRNNEIRRSMLNEVGKYISKRLNRQMYPVEFYGKVGLK